MERLSTEILEMIGNFVDDKPTQRALTESSVEFHTLFTPRLYSSITYQASGHPSRLISFDDCALRLSWRVLFVTSLSG